MRALVIEHEQDAPSGHLHDWLEQRDIAEDVFRIGIDDRTVDPVDYSLVVSLGSEASAADDALDWIARERQLLLTATGDGVPVLGICFGGQLLARVLGGRARRAELPEIGWRQIQTREAALVSDGPWFQWHFDTFIAPPHASVIADNEAGQQAFVLGPNLGVQFHPEVTPEIVEGWVTSMPNDLAAQGIDRDRLMDETHDRAAAARSAAWRLFDAFLDRARLAEGSERRAV